MGNRSRIPRRELWKHLADVRPDIGDPLAAIAAGRVTVGGRIVKNPRSLVRRDAVVGIEASRPLRGEAKLAAALDAFDVAVCGRAALALRAAAGSLPRLRL